METSISQQIKKIVEDNLDKILAGRLKRTLKEDNSFVTEGDMLCQNLVIDYARSIEGGYEVVSEEMDLSSFLFDENKNYIVIDPIDGTENFTSGLKEWGVSVCVYEKGKHKESMLLLPELGLSVITGDQTVRPEYHSRIQGISSTSLYKEFRENLSDEGEYRLTGCSVSAMYNVVTGLFKSHEKPAKAKMWDIIAGLNLALEHKLSVLVDGQEYQGEFLLPSKKYSFKINRV
mgnify:CR=1 FL=1